MYVCGLLTQCDTIMSESARVAEDIQLVSAGALRRSRARWCGHRYR